MPFEFIALDLPEVLLIEPRVFSDERGFFMETYKRSEFSRHGIDEFFVQGNHSHSSQGSLRGLHFQKAPKAQGKLIRVVFGAIFDVVVDIRKGSPHFGRWVGVEFPLRTNGCYMCRPDLPMEFALPARKRRCFIWSPRNTPRSVRRV